LATMVRFGGITFLPFYLQVAAGIGVDESGLYLLPLMIGIVVSAVASGRLVARTGRYRIFPVAGLALAAASFLVFAAVGRAEPGSGLITFLTTVGLGLGMVMPILTVCVQNAVERSDLGAATSSLAFFRSIGGAVGVALFGAVLANGLERFLPETLSPAARARLLDGGPLHGGRLAGAFQGQVADAFVDSYRIVFAAAGTVCVLAWLAALSVRELVLRREP
ncbi:MAG TPA: MFS transporter, partial [Arenibaculum sp.]|nr:MFS transporter [Arenibaculum sp.]